VKRFGFLAVLALCFPAFVAASTVLYPGHSAIWYTPERDGEGYVLEMLGQNRATLTWFTYDSVGGQRWIYGVGEVVTEELGPRILFQDLFVTSGGRFGPQFDPADVEQTRVGSATLEFEDCNIGTLSYSVLGEQLTVQVTRIAETMGIECASPHGTTGAPPMPHAGWSGTWFDPSHNGEGFQLQWIASGQALVTWYSYDPTGRQYWMTGVGVLVGDTIVFPSLQTTRGARFGSSFRSEDVIRQDWGSLTIHLSCDGGQADYGSVIDGFGEGSQDLARLTALLTVACPWTKRGLGDIYSVDIASVPTQLEPGTGRNVVQLRSIADDGTIIGAVPQSGLFTAFRLEPGASSWEELDTPARLGAAIFQVHPSGDAALFSEDVPAGGAALPIIWQEGVGGERIPMQKFEQSTATGASIDLSVMVGIGRPLGDPALYPWIWTAGGGQRELPLTPQIPLAYPQATSSDGGSVFGFEERPMVGRPPQYSAVMWKDESDPTYLYDRMDHLLGPAFVCDLDCSVAFGSDQAAPTADHPSYRQAWYRLQSGVVGYLGTLPDAFLEAAGPAFFPRGAAADGSLVVGTYRVVESDGALGTESFLWTEFTGMISMRGVLAENGVAVASWDEIHAMDVSSQGDKILVFGITQSGGASEAAYQGVVVNLNRLNGANQTEAQND
jgi:hypothetical protein